VDAMALELLGWRGTEPDQAIGSLNSDKDNRRMTVNYRDVYIAQSMVKPVISGTTPAPANPSTK
jgi:hypothetical protein